MFYTSRSAQYQAVPSVWFGEWLGRSLCSNRFPQHIVRTAQHTGTVLICLIMVALPSLHQPHPQPRLPTDLAQAVLIFSTLWHLLIDPYRFSPKPNRFDTDENDNSSNPYPSISYTVNLVAIHSLHGKPRIDSFATY